MGHVFTNEGLKIDSEKTKAVKQMPTPTIIEEVQWLNRLHTSDAEVHSFLGLASYCSRFIPDFTTAAEPLRQLGVDSTSPERHCDTKELADKCMSWCTMTHLHLRSCTLIQVHLVWEQSWPGLRMAELDLWLMPVVLCLTWSADTHKCKGKPWQLFGAVRSSISISTRQNLMCIQISSPSRQSVPNTNIIGCFPTV